MNVFKEAKKYQKLHPKTDWQTAIQKVSGKSKTVSGAKKKTTAVKRKAKVGAVSSYVPKAGKVSGVKTAKRSAISGVEKTADALVRNINRLETKRSKLKTKQEKDVYALIINAEHKKIDNLKKQLKSR